MARFDRLIDDLMDVTVVPGYTRLGFALRSRSRDWEQLVDGAMNGRTVVITGATSGLGLATARRLRTLGANLVLVGRDRERTERAAREIAGSSTDTVDVHVADMAEPAQVREVSTALARLGTIDVLVHNAGALSKGRVVNSIGMETTLAAQVIGPHIMTTSLIDSLVGGRVITVSSGGMYAAPLPNVDDPTTSVLRAAGYDGTRQYAAAKRMQVTLNEMWATRESRVCFAAMHPGWADTPGVRTSLPGFARITGPLLRDADEGADTTVWLAATRTDIGSGGFWCDRARRPIHKLPSTRRSDTPDRREALWRWCEGQL